MSKKFDKNELKERLSEEEFRVTQLKGTERPFTGKFNDSSEKGLYTCIVCGEELFGSTEKYDAGCGWPSFWQSLDQSKIKYTEDSTLGMKRTEIQCANCDSHLGHVFPDGPQPTNTRYCVNSVSLDFKKKD